MKAQIKPTILKLGGSVITDKSKPYSFLTSVVKRVAREISMAKPDGLVIVHGGGSFGHPLAREYNLAAGFVRHSQLEGFVKTRQAMLILNKLIIEALVDEGIKPVSLQPSAFIITRNGRIVAFDTVILSRMLGLGLTPVLYGDVVLDQVNGFSILSGDQIVSRLASVLGSKRIILACDVDGVYTADPKIHHGSKLVRKLTLPDLKKIKVDNSGRVSDVTGSMAGKLDEMVPALKMGIPVVILNGLKRRRIHTALKGLTPLGTTISFK
ncbi:MAG: isopentenyl phosphate kinase [Candidatus Bathyarchaeota archaeon]